MALERTDPFLERWHPMRPRQSRTHGIHGWWFYPSWKIWVNGKDFSYLENHPNRWNHQPDWFSPQIIQNFDTKLPAIILMFLRIPGTYPPISSRSSRLASSLRIHNITTWKLGSAVPVMIGYVYIYISLSGWWYTYPSEKYESVGMITPNIWKSKKKKFQTTNQRYIVINICVCTQP